MARTYKKAQPDHEQLIYEARKRKKSASYVRQKLLEGWKGSEPVDLSVAQINRIGQLLEGERDQLYASRISTKAAPEGLRLLTRRLLLVIERETIRIERAEKAGKLDANRIARLAGAAVKLYALIERSEEYEGQGQSGKAEPNAGAETPEADAPAAVPSFADELLEDAVPPSTADQGTENGGEGDGAGDGRPASNPSVELPATPSPSPPLRAVPNDLTDQDTGGGFGDSHASGDGMARTKRGQRARDDGPTSPITDG